MKYSLKTEGIIVRTGVPAPLKAPTHWPSFPLKSLFLLSFFLFHLLLRYFRQTLHPHATPSWPLIRQINLPWFKKISKEWFYYFTSSTVAFYQKSIFNLLNPFTNREINLNLYGIFLGSFLDNFEWLFSWSYGRA